MFEGGKLFPRGLGPQPNGADLGSILGTTEIHSAFLGLAREDDFETFTAPYRTHENATIFGGKTGGNGGKNNDAYHVYLDAATHARERGLFPDRQRQGVIYGEYIPSGDRRDVVYAAMRAGNAKAATDRHYETRQVAYQYSTSGAFSRTSLTRSLNRVNGFTVEFGFGN
ncbi:hypothetical protein DL771_003068 [Monosporascus sp. 5C6A]|nr:hypothetical protein DL771_003068 [Monosporascus sp. 5C6A]